MASEAVGHQACPWPAQLTSLGVRVARFSAPAAPSDSDTRSRRPLSDISRVRAAL